MQYILFAEHPVGETEAVRLASGQHRIFPGKQTSSCDPQRSEISNLRLCEKMHNLVLPGVHGWIRSGPSAHRERLEDAFFSVFQSQV